MGKKVTGHVRLVHANAIEAEERAVRLRAAGWRVVVKPIAGSPALRELREDPPEAVVIDLSRAFSHGRDVALALRGSKATRQLPLVLVEGDPDKIAALRKLLPDATYTSWRGIRGALRRAIARPPREPVVPASGLEGYSGTPLPKKLGIKPNSTVALVGAPRGFHSTLGTLPAGVTVREQARGRCDLIVWFVKSRRDLERRVRRLGDLAGSGGLWICWPKQASGVPTDLSQATVREIGLASGLVDYKIAAIDATWSGLRFTRRKPS